MGSTSRAGAPRLKLLILSCLITYAASGESCCERAARLAKLRTIPDPDAVAPEQDALGNPRLVPNSTMTKPSYWDDDDDGVWEPPLIPNPDYTWSAPLIDNPDYNPPTFLEEFKNEVQKAVPWVVVGVLIAAAAEALQLPSKISSFLSGTGTFGGALVGLATPLCSCGALPVAAGILRSGVPLPTVVAFLAGSQSAGLDSAAITWGLLGPAAALWRLGGALLIAVAAGLAAPSSHQAKQKKKKQASTLHDPGTPEVIYHVVQKSLWDKAAKEGVHYFPPRYNIEGFMHATHDPKLLLGVLNWKHPKHGFIYKNIQDTFLCVSIDTTVLESQVKMEAAIPTESNPNPTAFPHIFGPLVPANCVIETREVVRDPDDGTFLSIKGLCGEEEGEAGGGGGGGGGGGKRGVLASLQALWAGAVQSAADTFPPVLLGLMLSAAVTRWLPSLPNAPHELGAAHGLPARLAILAASVPLQLCEHTTVTAAAAIQKAGGSAGLSFAFLLAAPATNLPSLLLLFGAPVGKAGQPAAETQPPGEAKLAAIRVAGALTAAALLLSYIVDAAKVDLLVEREASAGGSAAFALPGWLVDYSPWLAAPLAATALVKAVTRRFWPSKSAGGDSCCDGKKESLPPASSDACCAKKEACCDVAEPKSPSSPRSPRSPKHMTTVQLRQCLRKAGVTYADGESQQELIAKVEALGVVGGAPAGGSKKEN